MFAHNMNRTPCSDHDFVIDYGVLTDTRHGCGQSEPCWQAREFMENDLESLGKGLMAEYATRRGRPSSSLCGVELVAGYACQQLVASDGCALRRTLREVRPLSHLRVISGE